MLPRAASGRHYTHVVHIFQHLAGLGHIRGVGHVDYHRWPCSAQRSNGGCFYNMRVSGRHCEQKTHKYNSQWKQHRVGIKQKALCVHTKNVQVEPMWLNIQHELVETKASVRKRNNWSNINWLLLMSESASNIFTQTKFYAMWTSLLYSKTLYFFHQVSLKVQCVKTWTNTVLNVFFIFYYNLMLCNLEILSFLKKTNKLQNVTPDHTNVLIYIYLNIVI